MSIFRVTHYATTSIVYIFFATSSHEQTGNIITFAQFEEGDLVENERNAEEDESISDSIDETYRENYYYDRYISMSALKDIQDGSQIHPGIITRDAILKLRDCIRKIKSECKGAELSANNMGKGLYKVFKKMANELNNSLSTLV